VDNKITVKEEHERSESFTRSLYTGLDKLRKVPLTEHPKAFGNKNYLKFRVFWDIAPCSHIEVNRRFRGAYCLQHQGGDDVGSTYL
jgi:hypothetical protein